MIMKIDKPWGREEILHEEGNARFKRLVISAGETLSLQYHHDKDEFIICVKGSASVLIQITHKEFEEYKLDEGQSHFVRRKTVHRIKANGYCELIELACGSDEDIVRISDKYGRV